MKVMIHTLVLVAVCIAAAVGSAQSASEPTQAASVLR